MQLFDAGLEPDRGRIDRELTFWSPGPVEVESIGTPVTIAVSGNTSCLGHAYPSGMRAFWRSPGVL
ncbi:hypothetical protein SCOCK_340007 [Actinacidiphila cocklensis]|uniref:Uncharacterized protein n=1 Tax=Actinacidiphila cocklensis TaxID=887465 RepID=A0A9W4DSS2_9ACTN|nr:hypothetical protein SCOCK_340007 [Actinacidiphila cocklensis]